MQKEPRKSRIFESTSFPVNPFDGSTSGTVGRVEAVPLFSAAKDAGGEALRVVAGDVMGGVAPRMLNSEEGAS